VSKNGHPKGLYQLFFTEMWERLAFYLMLGILMGGWFLSTAVGNKLSGFISGLAPTAGMFLVLALPTLLAAIFILVLLPRLDRTIKQYGG